MRNLLLLAVVIPLCSGADLAYSTYLRDGLTPGAITSDAQGNLYLAGSMVIDPLSRATSSVVAKLDPTASRYLYLEFLDSAAAVSGIGGIAVDGSGNLFVTGTTSNPNFQVTGNGQLGTLPTGPNDARGYVTKLSPNGVAQFSVLIGGSAFSTPSGIAVTPQGQILISGISGKGFPATPGAFSIPDTTNHWFLMELDPSGSKVVFSATGIGGSSIALDATGNIFLAGSTVMSTDYPTTPGAFQTSFVQGHVCFGLCQIGFGGGLQHLTKVDPTGSKLIYSTGINDITGLAGSTLNRGLAVDAAGSAYVTGTLLEAQYPFTVPSPNSGATNFLTKLDPTGSSVVFSLPVGGAGIAVDPSGAIYTAGTIAASNENFGFVPVPPIFNVPAALSWIPAACLPNNLTATSASYLLKLDSSTGKTLDAQWIDGSGTTVSAATLVGTKLWVFGSTLAPDVPFTPGALAPTNIVLGPLQGAFLYAADFVQPPVPASGAPVITCVLDGGNMSHAGAVAPYQILSIFGANLGPATGVQAPDGTDPSIAGVTVTFDGNPAEMIYVSSSQINVMVPVPPASHDIFPFPQTTLMQVSLKGSSIQRQLPFTPYNLNLFADITLGSLNCQGCPAFQPRALNPDGTRNSSTNPVKLSSLVSLFVHGSGTNQFGLPVPKTVTGILAQVGSCPVAVENATLAGIVYQVDLRLSAGLLGCSNTTNPVFPLSLTLTYNGVPVGPLVVNANPIPATPVQSQPMRVWVTQ